MPRLMSSLRLESASLPPSCCVSVSCILTELSHIVFPRGSGLERIKASRAYVPSDEDLRHGLTEDNQPVGVGSVHGALWVVCCSRCSNRQLFGEFGEDTRAAGALAPPVSLETDLVGPRGVSWPAPLPSEL